MPELTPAPTEEKETLFKSRKTRVRVEAWIQATVAVAATILAQKFQVISEEQANHLITNALVFIGSIAGISIGGIAHEDAAEKKSQGPNAKPPGTSSLVS